MLPRRKNMLEAFKQSDASGAPPASGTPPPLPTGSASSLGSAGSSGLGSGATSDAPSLFDGLGAHAGARQPALALALIGLVLSFVMGFLVGRGSSGEARAEEADASESAQLAPPPATQPRAFQERPGAAPAGAVAGTPTRIEDSPLFDPNNLQTVVVASYSKSGQGPDLAWATYEHLREANLPVFPPVESRNLVIVLAGAAPSASELKRTEAAVQALSRDGKKKDYADAYTMRIDTLIPRTPKGSSKP